MKKAILILLSILFLCSSLVFAHPGRTDSNGGHWVRTEGWGYEVGTYHYHNSGYSQTAPKETQAEKENRIKQKQEELLRQREEDEKERLREQRRKEREEFENRGQNAIGISIFISFIWFWWIIGLFSILKEKEFVTEIKILNPPLNIHINEKGFPEGFYNTEKGKASYTIYYSYGKYHQYFCRYAKTAKHSCSLADNTAYRPNTPCSLCERPLPDLNWFKKAPTIKLLDLK